MIQKLAGLKTTLWTGLIVAITFVLIHVFQIHWQGKLALISYALHGLFGVVILFSAQYTRSRITLLMLVILAFYLVEIDVVQGKLWLLSQQKLVFTSAILVLALLTTIKDRGLLSVHGLVRVVAVISCVLLAKGWLIVESWLSYYLNQQSFSSSVFEQILTNVPLFIVALFILYKSLRHPDLFVSSLLTTLVITQMIYQQQLDLPLVVVLVALVLQFILVVVVDSYYLAYRDELTNLPSRRALQQYSLSLGRHYCVAMLDIDHFKKFNDTYGHDIGDQVLKLVASKLAKIGNGGRVFRYGGEEFTAIFPRKSADDALNELEKLRRSVADYKIVIRHPLRKDKKARQGKQSKEFKNVSVTISIGVATREAKESFEQTVKQADLALYRAKKKGRNNVSH